jgi:hypothetical protein
MMKAGALVAIAVAALIAARSGAVAAPATAASLESESLTAAVVAAAAATTSCRADPSDWAHAYTEDGLPPPLASFSAAHNASLFWGHFRPSVYWGLRTRSWPTAAALGLMWASPIPKHLLPKQGANAPRLPLAARVRVRHECREGNGVAPFGFDRHDGRGFARQKLTDADAGVQLITHFAKPQLLPGDSLSRLGAPPSLPGSGGRAAVALSELKWVARVAGEPIASSAGSKGVSAAKPLALLLYVGFDCDGLVRSLKLIRSLFALESELRPFLALALLLFYFFNTMLVCF